MDIKIKTKKRKEKKPSSLSASFSRSEFDLLWEVYNSTLTLIYVNQCLSIYILGVWSENPKVIIERKGRGGEF